MTRWFRLYDTVVDEIGAAAFNAYFGEAGFAPGPPAMVTIAKPHLRALARRFAGALQRAFGACAVAP